MKRIKEDERSDLSGYFSDQLERPKDRYRSRESEEDSRGSGDDRRRGDRSRRSGLLLGVWSHIALDSVMHADMMPFAPFRGDNPWWGQVPLEPLHWLCIMTGIAGVPLVFLRR